jgi:hypothetical protein
VLLHRGRPAIGTKPADSLNTRADSPDMFLIDIQQIGGTFR